MNPLKDPGWWWVRRVVVTLAVLAAVLVLLSLFSMTVNLKSAKVDRVHQELGWLATASRHFRDRTGQWPKTGGALEPDGTSACLPYYDRDQPIDPWGRPYHFDVRAGRLEIRSGGDDATLWTRDDFVRLVATGPGTAHTPAGGP